MIKKAKNKIYAAISMLIVAAILLVQASYAWLSLSTSPEVTNVDTVLGANGSLEIALATDEHLTSLVANDMYEDSVSSFKSTGILAVDNTNWGNIIDLSDDCYGFDQISLKPTSLNVIDNAIQDTPINIPKYGRDGRITLLSSSSAAGIFDKASKSFLVGGTPQYGVRAAGTTANTSLINTVNEFVDYIDPALKSAISTSDSVMLDLYFYGKSESTNYTLNNLRSIVDSAKNLYSAVESTVDPLEGAFSDMFSSIVGEAIESRDKIEALTTEADSLLIAMEEAAAETGVSVATAEEIDSVLGLLVGQLGLYYRVYENKEYVYKPMEQYSADIDSEQFRIKLGTESIFALAGKIYSYEMNIVSDAYNEPDEKLYYYIDPEGETDIVSEVNNRNMDVVYEGYKSSLEVYFTTVNAHRDAVYSLLKEEYEAVQKFFYSHALFESENADEETYSCKEWVTNGIGNRINKLEEEIKYIKEYIDYAINAYASSGDLSASIYDSVQATSLGPITELSAAGLDSEKYLLAARSCEEYQSKISSIQSRIRSLYSSLTIENEDGSTESRDALTYDELKTLWESYIDIEAIMVGGYGINEFGEHADQVFVDSLCAVSVSENSGIMSQVANLIYFGNLNDFEVTLSDITRYNVSDGDDPTQYLSGNNIDISLPSFNYEIKEGKNTFNVDGTYLDVVILSVNEKLAGDSNKWNAAYEEFLSSKTILESDVSEKEGSRLVADVYIEYEIAGEETNYSIRYLSELEALVNNYVALTDKYEAAIFDLIYLCATGIDEKFQEQKEAEKEESGEQEEPDEEEKTVCELLDEAVEENKTVAELIDIVKESSSYNLSSLEHFDECIELYDGLVETLESATAMLEELKNNNLTSLTFGQINSVLSYFVTDVKISQKIDSIVPQNIYSSTYALVNDQIITAVNDGYASVLLEPEENISRGWYGKSEDKIEVLLPTETTLTKVLSIIETSTTIRSLLIGRHDFSVSNTFVSTVVENRYDLYPYYLLTYGNEQVSMTDRQYIYHMTNQFMSKYYVHATEYYTEYINSEVAMLELVNRIALKDINGLISSNALCTFAELNDAYDSVVSLKKAFESYLDYVEYATLLQAASSETSEDEFVEAVACENVEEMFGVLGLKSGDDLFDSYVTAKESYDTALQVCEEMEKLLGITEGYEDRELLSLSPVVKEMEPIIDLFIDLDGLTINGESIDDFTEALEEQKVIGINTENILGSTPGNLIVRDSEPSKFVVSKTGTYTFTSSKAGSVCQIYDSKGKKIYSNDTEGYMYATVDLQGGETYSIMLSFTGTLSGEVSVGFERVIDSSEENNPLSNYEELIQSIGVSIEYSSGLPSDARSIFGLSGSVDSINTSGIDLPWGYEEKETEENGTEQVQNYLTGVNSQANIAYSDNRYMSETKQDVVLGQYPSDSSVTGLNTTSNYILLDKYCFAIDMLFRTNVDGANLILQTEERQRIYQDLAERNMNSSEAMQGGGSYIHLENEDMRNALRVVFADTLSGEIYATAYADKDGYLYLEDGTDTITSLQEDQVKAVTAWVYIDGRYVNNSSAAIAIEDELEINLQFATDVELLPYNTMIRQ